MPRLRSTDLAIDTTTNIDSLRDFSKPLIPLKSFKGTYVVLLQPTNPLRKVEDVSKTIALWAINTGTKSIYSVSSPIQSPKDLIKFSKNGKWQPVIAENFNVINRQAVEKI